MEYERIEKVQKSMLSPTKLRMKLMGSLNNKNREGSSNNSSRTSPVRLQVSDGTEFSKNSLLASKSDSYDDDNVAASTTDIGVSTLSVLDLSDTTQASRHRSEGLTRENNQPKPQQLKKADVSMALRPQEDENLDYDSNASSSSFEFHGGVRGERSNQSHVSRAYFSRQMPSKWNDAEKWIMSRQNMVMSKNGQGNRMPVRVMTDNNNTGYEHNKSRIQTDGSEKFPNYIPTVPHPVLTQGYGGHSLIDQSTQSNDTTKDSPRNDTPAGPVTRSVCMRDMGTDMTPIPSQEPSRSVTPVGATTPLRSPASSLPSTPRRRQQEESQQDPSANTKRELSEEEIKAKTRREIVSLGVRLGKMNIAAWASKEEEGSNENKEDVEETQRIEFGKRANAWEEAEKSKHNARYKREEIRIQAWESREKARLEAEMQRIEAKVEQMKAEAEAKIVKKIAMARQRSEEKRASAEARKARDADKAVAEAEYIRETGRIPTSGSKICCGWFS
ncbi:hypothetical protein Bca4012_054780 [Brassica carinata]